MTARQRRKKRQPVKRAVDQGTQSKPTVQPLRPTDIGDTLRDMERSFPGMMQAIADASAPDAARVSKPPSKVTDRYWLQAWAPNRQVTPRVGKWLIRVPATDVDDAWERIKVALKAGRLGPSAKVRTAVPHPIYSNDVKVICVYTSDHQDEADKQRVRKVLRRLGFNERLRYKTDDETRCEAAP